MNRIRVTHLANHRYQVTIGRHSISVDQPRSAGGDDDGPTAVELFASSLVACCAHYAASYLARHGLPADGLTVEGEFTMAADAPARVAEMSVSITPPAGLTDPRAAALLAVTSNCTVHNTLRQAPTVSIGLALPATTADEDQSRRGRAA
jgi:uncharacterized OsmC-like protein